jgi:hypothetical protein
MLTIKIVRATILSIILFASCSPKAIETKDEWKEMDDFHMVMAEAFHPYKDSANLEPAKANAQQLAAAAKKWKDAPLPEKVSGDEVKAKLTKLEAEATQFSQTVQTASDTTIAKSLISLHDLFHELQEEWYDAKEESHEHH